MKDDRIYLDHSQAAIKDIERYTATGRDAFMTDRMQQDAVIRKLEIAVEKEIPRLQSAVSDLITQIPDP